MYDNLFANHIEINPESNLIEATAVLPAGAGVCLFVTADNQPITLIYAASLRNLARRRLIQQQARQADLSGIVGKIYYCNCYSKFEMQLRYFHLAREIYPDDYQKLLPKLDAWFLKFDDKDIPYFCASRKYNNGQCWGPFAINTPVNNLIEILQDLFGLCRNYGNLRNRKSCSYGQMNICQGLCTGKISTDEYKKVCRQAIDFLNSSAAENTALIKSKINELSRQLKFEQAGKLHQHLKTLDKIYDKFYVGLIENFWVIVCQPGPKITGENKRAIATINTFIVGPGIIRQIEPFSEIEITQSSKAIIDHLNLCQMQKVCTPIDDQLLGWLANQIDQKDTKKGLFIIKNENLNENILAKKLNEYYTNQIKKQPIAKPEKS